MQRGTRGQQPLPGATESLLQATTAGSVPAPDRWADYTALSVVRSADGSVSVRLLRLDPATRRVVPVLLDRVDPEAGSLLTPVEMLLYWAQELASGWEPALW